MKRLFKCDDLSEEFKFDQRKNDDEDKQRARYLEEEVERLKKELSKTKLENSRLRAEIVENERVGG